MQMAQVAIGWQVYSIHHSAFDLGLIGLAEFVPVPLLALPAGQLADRLPRCVVIVGGFADAGRDRAAPRRHAPRRAPALAVPRARRADRDDSARSATRPAARSCRELVPAELLSGALALRSIAGQVGDDRRPGARRAALRASARKRLRRRHGPARRLVADRCSGDDAARDACSARAIERAGPASALLAGIRFIRDTPVILGAITLDLFAVLFGGSVALLPLFAQVDPPHRPVRARRAAQHDRGRRARSAGFRLARRPLGGRAGRTLLLVVGTFGASMVVFGLSRWFWLSSLALAVSGFVDMYR